MTKQVLFTKELGRGTMRLAKTNGGARSCRESRDRGAMLTRGSSVIWAVPGLCPRKLCVIRRTGKRRAAKGIARSMPLKDYMPISILHNFHYFIG